MKKHISSLLLGLLFVPSLVLADSLPFPDPIPATAYFPLHDGNQWEYQESCRRSISFPDISPANRVIDCDLSSETATFKVASLTGTFWGDLTAVKLRVDLGPTFPAGQVYASKLDSYGSGLLLSPSLEDGAYASAFEPECLGTQKQMSVLPAGTVTVPAGTFDNCIKITLNCPILQDLGVSYTLAPNVGIIRYSTVSLAGSCKEELVRAVVDGEVIEGFPETGPSACLSIDRFLILGKYEDLPTPGPGDVAAQEVTYPKLGVLRAKFDIKNDTADPIILGYRDQCTFPEYSICDSAGNQLWNSFSAIRCAGGLETETIAAGETKSHQIRIHLNPALNNRWAPAGYYTLKVTSRTTPQFSAEVPFLIEYQGLEWNIHPEAP